MSPVEDVEGGSSPASLKRKRELEEYSHPRVSPAPFKAPKLVNGLSGSSLAGLSHPTAESGDMLQGVDSASSLASTTSSIFSSTSKLAANQRSALGNGDSPLTAMTDSSPPKTSSPQTASSSTNASARLRPDAPSSRPSIFPKKGAAKGYRVVWDPELDGKLSKEERKRATVKRRDFGLEVRYIFHHLLSLRNNIHIILELT